MLPLVVDREYLNRGVTDPDLAIVSLHAPQPGGKHKVHISARRRISRLHPRADVQPIDTNENRGRGQPGTKQRCDLSHGSSKSDKKKYSKN